MRRPQPVESMKTGRKGAAIFPRSHGLAVRSQAQTTCDRRPRTNGAALRCTASFTSRAGVDVAPPSLPRLVADLLSHPKERQQRCAGDESPNVRDECDALRAARQRAVEVD